MIRTVLVLLFDAVIMVAVSAAQAVPQNPFPSDADVRKILTDRIDVQHQSVGIVIGLIGPEGRRTIAYGHLDKGDSRPLNGDTVFEIGSATKVFT